MAKGRSEKPAGPASIQNRKARHDYEIVDTYEAGLVLQGPEVKSLYLGRANLTDAYAEVTEGEIWIVNFDIEPYEHTHHFPHERRRKRKLLMHKNEIETIGRKAKEKGLTLVPLAIYFKNGRAKAEIALARGRRQYDKREAIAAKETRREVERARSERG